jgi:hypothetical protein
MKGMKKWKNLAALSVMICLILSLTACGGSQKAPESGTSVEKDSQTSSGQESVPVEAATQDEAADVTAAETAAADVTAAETAAADATAAEIAEPSAVPDYAKEENWAYFGLGEDKDADLFLICPTVDTRDEYNMSMDDEEVKQSFSGALNMERGIYEDNTRMFAPYYRQAAMKIYNLSPEEREPYLELAYQDVSAAFSWYLENKNEGRPIVLAGFSQGADMCYRILKEYFGDSALQQQLVAVYAIGWPMTEQMIAEYPQIVPAASENDTGVVVSFECESEDVTGTLIIPEDMKALSINPLNWVTDSTPADKSLNTGACFTSYSGKIKQEVPELCGCYIDPERGALKVTDIMPEEYPPILSFLPEGSYHLYDYQFYFRNLQQNVEQRIKAYMESLAENAA